MKTSKSRRPRPGYWTTDRMLDYATELYGLEFGCGQEATDLRKACIRAIRYHVGKESEKEKDGTRWVLPEGCAHKLIEKVMRGYFEDKADPKNAGVRAELRKVGVSLQGYYDEHRDDLMAELSDIEIDARDGRGIAPSRADGEVMFRTEVLGILDVLINLSSHGGQCFDHAGFREDFEELRRIDSYDEDDLTAELRSRRLALSQRLENPMRYLKTVASDGS